MKAEWFELRKSTTLFEQAYDFVVLVIDGRVANASNVLVRPGEVWALTRKSYEKRGYSIRLLPPPT